MANRKNVQKNRRLKMVEREDLDYSLILIVLFLLGFGIIMIYSASSYDTAIDQKFGYNSTYYLRKQLIAVGAGLVAMVFVAQIPYHFWKHLAVLGYIVSAILILLVLTPIGISANGARRWLDLGFTTLQPAEVAKAAIIVFLATLICKLGGHIEKTKVFWIVFFVPTPLCLLVYVITSNLSSAIIIFGIGVIMLFVASAEYKKFVIMASAVLVGAIGFVLYLLQLDTTSSDLNYRSTRILSWLNPEMDATGTGFQTLQSLYAIGSGGIFGKGLGESMQKLGFLPETQNDMIFAIICEELGLFGGIAIILLFLLLIWRFMVIASLAQDLFGTLLVVGVMAHISIQVILNIAVVTNTIPNTGISLPFISYGGSSVLFLLIEIGIVLSVAKGRKIKNL